MNVRGKYKYMKANQSHTRELKLELIRRIVVGGEGLAAVARSVDLDEKTVARWRREYARDPENAFPRSPLQADMQRRGSAARSRRQKSP